jgi:hypothetical protein
MASVIARLSVMVKRHPAAVRALAPLVASAKRIPVVGDGVRRALRPSGTGSFDPAGYVRATAEQVGTQELVGPVNLIRYATHSKSAYAGEQFPAGYHTLRVGSIVLRGQREPGERLDLLTSDICDLGGLSVLDLGSNQGGMSFAALERGARWAVGVDYDPRMVNTANRIATARGDTGKAAFYTHDVDRDPHDLLRDFLPEETADIIFLLAVCAWIDCWKELIAWAAANSPRLLFESNGSPAQQRRQVEQLRTHYPVVRLLAQDSSDDGEVLRSLYFCSGAPGQELLPD